MCTVKCSRRNVLPNTRKHEFVNILVLINRNGNMKVSQKTDRNCTGGIQKD